MLHVFGALAEFDLELIRERTQAGLGRAAGRAAGHQNSTGNKLSSRERSWTIPKRA